MAAQVAEALCIDCPAAVEVSTKTTGFVSMVNGEHQVFTAEGRKVGIYVLPGFDVKAVEAVKAALTAAKATPMIVGDRQKVKGSDGAAHAGQFTLETSRSTHFDAVVVVGGEGGDYASKLNSGRMVHVVREAFMHHKAIMVLGQAVDWAANLVLPAQGLDLSGQDGNSAGVVFSRNMPAETLKTFVDLVANHRVWDRDVATVAA
jgi:catalase